MSWYRVGTVSVTNGSPTVNGSGTGWFGITRSGDAFVGPDKAVYEVLSVSSDLQLTLASPYGGSTVAGASYAIFATQSWAKDLVIALNAIASGYDLNTMAASTSPLGAAARMLVSQSGANRHIRFQDLQQEVLNAFGKTMLWKGGDPTGGASSSTAFYDTVAALSSGGTLIVPAGQFRINGDAISGINNLTLLGFGPGHSRLLIEGGSPISLDACENFRAAGISIQQYGAPQSVAGATGMALGVGSSNALIHDVHFLGFDESGLQMVGSSGTPQSGNRVTHCMFLGNGNRQLFMSYSNDFRLVDNQYGSLASYTASVGSRLENCSAGQRIGDYHWNNGRGSESVNCNYNRNVAVRFEESEQEGYWQSGGAHTILDACQFHTNSRQASGAYDGAYFVNAPRLSIVNNQTFSFDSGRHRWDLNIDSGCSNATVKGNNLAAYSSSFGPIRVAGDVLGTLTTDAVMQISSGATLTTDSLLPVTWFLGDGRASFSEAAVAQFPGAVSQPLRVFMAVEAPPGPGKSFVYPLRVNGVDTGMSITISDLATVGSAAVPSPAVLWSPEDTISVKLIASAGSASTVHRGYIAIANR